MDLPLFICIYCNCQDVSQFIYQENVCRKCNQQYLMSPNVYKKNKIKCPSCTIQSQDSQIQCYMCGHVFQDKLDKIMVPLSIKKGKSLINCSKCNFQNHLSNQYCLNCEHQLFQHIKKTCQICDFQVNQNNYDKHYEECLLSKSMIQQEELSKIIQKPIIQPQIKPIQIKPYKEPYKPKFHKPELLKPGVKPIKPIKPIQKPGFMQGMLGSIKKPGFFSSQNKTCYYCNKKFTQEEYKFHQKQCDKKQQWSRSMETAFVRLTPLQAKAVTYMHQKSAKEHQALRTTLQKRVKSLNFKQQDLNNLQFYIQNYAPIIIQIHISKHMQFFVKDTHYRNQFQTNKSSGSLSRQSRTQWQNRMFDNKYDKATDFERVKYGVINFTNDPKGVQCAKGYGPSYFLLKSNVRDRCTFTDQDSSGANASIATLRYGFKIISKMNDNQLKAAIKASMALQQSSGVTATYKQLQIHGPIEFDKDIERIYVNKEQIKGQKNLLDLVYQFSQKFKVQHDFI